MQHFSSRWNRAIEQKWNNAVAYLFSSRTKSSSSSPTSSSFSSSSSLVLPHQHLPPINSLQVHLVLLLLTVWLSPRVGVGPNLSPGVSLERPWYKPPKNWAIHLLSKCIWWVLTINSLEGTLFNQLEESLFIIFHSHTSPSWLQPPGKSPASPYRPNRACSPRLAVSARACLAVELDC